ncbi:MAG: hypothetical protein VX152_10365, partial [Pseudomonadota bacterium]|nr:hypothetical protein [Pseudomonadota bacterium]
PAPPKVHPITEPKPKPADRLGSPPDGWTNCRNQDGQTNRNAAETVKYRALAVFFCAMDAHNRY